MSTKDASQTSNKTAAPPDPSRIDTSLGFVPATEIRNVWTEAMMRLDQELWPARGPVPPRDVILEFVQDLQFRLLTRASSNLEKILGKSMGMKKAALDEATVAMSEAARAAREARMAKYR